MMHTLIDAAGAVVAVVGVPDAQHLADNMALYPSAVASVEGMPPPGDVAYIGGSWVAAPPALAVLKTRKLDELQKAYLSAEAEDFAVGGNAWSADAEARLHIMQMVMMADLLPNFSVTWERADGTPIALNENQIRNLAEAMGNRVISVRNTWRSLRNQVAAAVNATQVAAVQWPP